MSRVRTLLKTELSEVGPAILQHLQPQSEDSFVLIEGDDFVLVKRASVRSPLQRFEKLASQVQERFADRNLGDEDVERAVRWARESS
jgi:hypothetical protein